jgi:hypothetical protein|tara:strand:- start:329 stop:571 length:243 start_codon:yes stop_codon:yes gene_type:complete
MLKKISHSDISLYVMPLFNSRIKKCEVCNKKLDNHKKMIVFDDRSLPMGFSCKYCNSVYFENDELVNIGNPDKVDLYGEA